MINYKKTERKCKSYKFIPWVIFIKLYGKNIYILLEYYYIYYFYVHFSVIKIKCFLIIRTDKKK